VPDAVTGDVEEVEGAVAEEVEGGELADFEAGVETYFEEFSSPHFLLAKFRTVSVIRFGRVQVQLQ